MERELLVSVYFFNIKSRTSHETVVILKRLTIIDFQFTVTYLVGLHSHDNLKDS